MTLPNLDPVTKTITSIAGPAASLLRKPLERQELVISILKKLKLDPEHPPADFTGVYKYALVEYGVGKAKPILELFRLAEIQQAFRQAFELDDPSMLLQKCDRFLEEYALGDEIKQQGIDWQRELAEYSAAFLKITYLTRTPAEVRRDQRIESLQQSLGKFQEHFESLPTAEAIRTELAELLQEYYPAATSHPSSVLCSSTDWRKASTSLIPASPSIPRTKIRSYPRRPGILIIHSKWSSAQC